MIQNIFGQQKEEFLYRLEASYLRSSKAFCPENIPCHSSIRQLIYGHPKALPSRLVRLEASRAYPLATISVPQSNAMRTIGDGRSLGPVELSLSGLTTPATLSGCGQILTHMVLQALCTFQLTKQSTMGRFLHPGISGLRIFFSPIIQARSFYSEYT